MTQRNPPRAAVWLLEKLGIAEQNPALTGDLLEVFRTGKSPAWFWRQTLTVIARGWLDNLRASRHFLFAEICGALLQAPIAVTLLSRDRLPHNPFVGLLIFITWFVATIAAGITIELLVGSGFFQAQRLLAARDLSPRDRTSAIRITVVRTFFSYFAFTCMAATFHRYSALELCCMQFLWLAIDMLVDPMRVNTRSPGSDLT